MASGEDIHGTRVEAGDSTMGVHAPRRVMPVSRIYTEMAATVLLRAIAAIYGMDIGENIRDETMYWQQPHTLEEREKASLLWEVR